MEMGASLAAARVARGLGHGQQARNRLEALLAFDPSVEEAYALAMEIAAEEHRPADVRDVFERCRRAMQTQLDAEPSPETLALAKRLLAS